MMSGSRANHFKLFTLEEARNLVPRVRELLTTIKVEKQELEGHIDALQKMTPAMKVNGHAAEAQKCETRIQELAESIQFLTSEISRIGIEVKDLENGIVDFPSLREGRIVYLCWHLDEETVEHWHELDDGYAGRRLIDDTPDGTSEWR